MFKQAITKPRPKTDLPFAFCVDLRFADIHDGSGIYDRTPKRQWPDKGSAGFT